ncbi:hypothetical protein [Streptomyces sp. NPDC003395]
MQNEQQRYELGKREENGRYPVRVDGALVGSVYRRHGSWYATMPGHHIEGRSTDRHAAAQVLVLMVDQGKRPTIPAQAARPRNPYAYATHTYSHLIPDLRLTLPNLVRAAEAMARLAEIGWTPLEGYPGADQPWLMECRLCGWEGRRFWSHLRGRNGDGIPRPITRHRGCLPVADHAEVLRKLRTEHRWKCECEYTHPTTVPQALDVLKSIEAAMRANSDTRVRLYSRAILEPCPASSYRAQALRHALDQMRLSR